MYELVISSINLLLFHQNQTMFNFNAQKWPSDLSDKLLYHNAFDNRIH